MTYKILIVVQSLSGNTFSFVEYAKENFPSHEYTIVEPRALLRDASVIGSFENFDKIMIGAYTWDMGKIPAHMKRWLIENREQLMEQDCLIFGSGWSIYETYCKAVESMNFILDNRFKMTPFELRFDPSVEVEAVKTLEDWMEEK